MATFTSVSLMSTSAWDDGSGCPIVSPSRWNPLVASNLQVIAAHDHSASAGEGASIVFAASYFPVMDVQYIYPWFPVGNASWVIENKTGWPGMGCMSTSNLGAYIEYDLYMRSGSWELVFIMGSGSAMGILSACIGGSALSFGASTVADRYATGAEVPGGSFAYNTANIASINMAPGANSGNGRKILRIQVTSKNANSSGYIGRVGYLKLRRYG